MGFADDARVRPDAAIEPSLEQQYSSRYVSFDPKFIDRFTAPETGDLPSDEDNAWLTRSGLLEAGPQENAEVLRLAIPAGTGRDGLHAVRARVERAASRRGGAPATRFQALVEDADSFETFDFTPKGRNARNQTRGENVYMEMGVFDLEDGVLDMEIDDVRGAWSVIYGFELAPALSVYESPALSVASLREKFDQAERLRLRAAADIPRGCEVVFQRRFAQVDASGEVAWGEWEDDPGALTDDGGEAFALSQAGDLIAWRVEMRRTSEQHPVVMDVRLERVGAN
jgi:hypothetical protein